MCGIFGIVYGEEKENIGEIFIKVAEKLTYRGYDSVGFATVDESGEYDLRKDRGKLKDVSKKYKLSEMKGYKGIVQLRWATFGKPSKENAQPHIDCRKTLVSAHNGNIVNTPELIEALKSRGHDFKGENDGEVVCHLIEDLLNSGREIDSAIREADNILRGDYAYVVTKIKEKKMFAVKKGSSLYLGIGEGFVCASSDLPSILILTKKYVPINDGEYIEFDNEKFTIKSIESGAKIEREPLEYEGDIESAELGEYPFFMEKEIYEQPKTASSLIKYIFEKDAKEFADDVGKSKRIFIIGSGTSYHASYLGAYFFNKLTDLLAVPVVSSEFEEFYDGKFSEEDAFLLVSQSGETKDTINVLNYLRKKGIERIFSLVNVLGSTLMMNVKKSFPVMSELEIGVAATKTFTNQVISLLGMASLLSGDKKVVEKLKDLPSIMEDFLNNSSNKVEKMAEAFYKSRVFYILGYGINYPSALEGALKMKEITYIPTEAFYSAEFKHGPLALIEDGQPVFFISTIEDKSRIISAINEIKVRGGRIITIAPEDESLILNSDEYCELRTDYYYFVPLLSVIFFQLLSYKIAVLRGNDPDQPRNLSKTITVD